MNAIGTRLPDLLGSATLDIRYTTQRALDPDRATGPPVP
jgi:hypothetical protein